MRRVHRHSSDSAHESNSSKDDEALARRLQLEEVRKERLHRSQEQEVQDAVLAWQLAESDWHPTRQGSTGRDGSGGDNYVPGSADRLSRSRSDRFHHQLQRLHGDQRGSTPQGSVLRLGNPSGRTIAIGEAHHRVNDDRNVPSYNAMREKGQPLDHGPCNRNKLAEQTFADSFARKHTMPLEEDPCSAQLAEFADAHLRSGPPVGNSRESNQAYPIAPLPIENAGSREQTLADFIAMTGASLSDMSNDLINDIIGAPHVARFETDSDRHNITDNTGFDEAADDKEKGHVGRKLHGAEKYQPVQSSLPGSGLLQPTHHRPAIAHPNSPIALQGQTEASVSPRQNLSPRYEATTPKESNNTSSRTKKRMSFLRRSFGRASTNDTLINNTMIPGDIPLPPPIPGAPNIIHPLRQSGSSSGLSSSMQYSPMPNIRTSPTATLAERIKPLGTKAKALRAAPSLVSPIRQGVSDNKGDGSREYSPPLAFQGTRRSTLHPHAMALAPNLASPNRQGRNATPDEKVRSQQYPHTGRAPHNNASTDTGSSRPVKSVCAVCQESSGSFLAALDQKYHPECFRCVACFETIDSYGKFKFKLDEHGVKQPYHIECHARLFGLKCSVCREAIMSSNDGQVAYIKHPFFEKEVMCIAHARHHVRVCSSCKRFEPHDEPFVELNDANRCCCPSCLQSVVVSDDELSSIWQIVLHFLDNDLGLPLWNTLKELPLVLISSDTLREQRNRAPRMPNGPRQLVNAGMCLTDFDCHDRLLRVPSFEYQKSSGSFEAKDQGFFEVPRTASLNIFAIVCLFGMPRILTGTVLVHEATLAWFQLHPGYNPTNPIPLEIQQACAQLIAVLYLSSESQKHLSTANADDGLRQYLKFSIEKDGIEKGGATYERAASLYRVIGMDAMLTHIIHYREFPSI